MSGDTGRLVLLLVWIRHAAIATCHVTFYRVLVSRPVSVAALLASQQHLPMPIPLRYMCRDIGQFVNSTIRVCVSGTLLLVPEPLCIMVLTAGLYMSESLHTGKYEHVCTVFSKEEKCAFHVARWKAQMLDVLYI